MEEQIKKTTPEVTTENKSENTVVKPTPKPRVSRAKTTETPAAEKKTPATRGPRTRSAAKAIEPVVEMPKAIEITEEIFAPIEKIKKNEFFTSSV